MTTQEETKPAVAMPGANPAINIVGSNVSSSSTVESVDFRKPRTAGSPNIEKLRCQHMEWLAGLEKKLTAHFRQPCTLELEDIRTLPCGQISQLWRVPSQLSIFKVEPLRGVALLQISNPLGTCLLNRLMGGTGEPAEVPQAHEMTDIEKALFEQTSRIILKEWCTIWPNAERLKPQILAVESEGQFLEIASKDAQMLAVTARFGMQPLQGLIHLAIPIYTISSLAKGRIPEAEASRKHPVRSAAAPISSHDTHLLYGEVPVTVTAEWAGIELSAVEILGLKTGEVLRLDGSKASSVSIRLGDQTRFQGRPGTLVGNWAVELTNIVRD
jgi:flagellar motor switch protein FliM